MIWRHPAHAGRTLRLAYCQNLHPADDLEETLAGMRAVTLPLRERLGAGLSFGVGMYLSNRFARTLASASGERDLYRLASFLETNGLDPFTFNAFPYERFHQDGLKSDVFKPTWKDPERLEFTLAVAKAAVAILRRTRSLDVDEHLSISTHTGMFGAHVRNEADLDLCAAQLARAVDEFARIEEQHGVRIVLALEPEPRANASDSAELVRFLERARTIGVLVLEEERNRSSERARSLYARHIGFCLDACHAAIEGDRDPVRTLEGVTLGKLQYSNAVVVRAPAQNASGVEALLALAEPRYLHQVTGHGSRRMQAVDLPELQLALQGADAAAWMSCDEWRCHFHVPVDRVDIGSGLSTTQSEARRLLGELVRDPSRWTTRELHVEIETYTWDVLKGEARGSGAWVDGLEREYRHVMAELQGAGWTRA
jgi:hypothetical protein